MENRYLISCLRCLSALIVDDLTNFVFFFLVLLPSFFVLIFHKNDLVRGLLFVWFLMPNRGEAYVSYYGVGLYSAAQFLLMLSLLCSFLIEYGNKNVSLTEISRHSAHPLRFDNHYNDRATTYFLLLLGITVICQNVFLPEILAATYGFALPPWSSLIRISIDEIYTFFFFVICYLKIKKPSDLRSALGCLYVFSLILISEYFLVKLMDFSLANATAHFDESGRFKSIFVNSYLTTSVLGGLTAILAANDHLRGGGKHSLFFLLLGIFLAVVNVKRSIILALVVGICVLIFFTFVRSNEQKMFLLRKTLLTAVFLTAFGVLGLLFVETFQFMGDYLNRRIERFFSLASLSERLDLWRASIEHLFQAFPFGLGVDSLRLYIGAGSEEVVQSLGNLGEHREEHYFSQSNSHNGYIEQVAGYGLLGLLVLMSYIYLLLRNLLTISIKSPEISHLQSLLFSIASFFAVYYVFVGFPRFGIFMALLLFGSGLLRLKDS